MNIESLSLLARMGRRHLSTIVPEALYMSAGIDLTRPTLVGASVTNRCNYKCLQCACWRMEPEPEMSLEQWTAGLASLREYLGRYRIQFAGGEPFVKKGFLEILEFCGREGVDFGVITNGSAFVSRRVVDRFVKAGPLLVTISVDGPTPELHDRLRGSSGSLKAIEAGIRNLREARKTHDRSFPIRIKTTLNASNYRTAPEIVRWAAAQGATSIDFEPIREWTDETRGALWPTTDECDGLEVVVSELLRMQAAGAPIETSCHKLRGMPDHFRRLPPTPEVEVCRIGLRAFSISPQGVVSNCHHLEPIGDLTRQSAREIWTGERAREVRRRTVACTRGCSYGCYATKPIPHTIRRGLKVFARPVVEPSSQVEAAAGS